MAHLLETRSAATASARFRALQHFYRWLVDDEDIEGDPSVRPLPSMASPWLSRESTGITDGASSRRSLTKAALVSSAKQSLFRVGGLGERPLARLQARWRER